MKDVLVIIRCGIDDIPLRIFENEELAKGFAYELAQNPSCLETELKAFEDVMDLDVSEPCAISIAVFHNGLPSRYECVVDL